jgi:hypothetical protein
MFLNTHKPSRYLLWHTRNKINNNCLICAWKIDILLGLQSHGSGCIELEGLINGGHCTCSLSGSMLHSVSGTNKVMPKVNSSLRTECHQHKDDTVKRFLLNIKKGWQDIMCCYEIRETKHRVRDIDYTKVGNNYEVIISTLLCTIHKRLKLGEGQGYDRSSE